MTLFALISLFVTVTCLGLAILILRAASKRMHQLWALFNIAVAWWSGCLFLVGIQNDPASAIFYWKLAYGGGMLVPTFFYHFLHIYCERKNKKIVFLIYVIAIFNIYLCLFTDSMVPSVKFIYNSVYYHNATPVTTLILSYVVLLVILCHIGLFRSTRSFDTKKRNQSFYLFFGFAFGWLGGASTFILPYINFQFYPAGHITIAIYALFMIYAIFCYQIAETSIVIKKSAIYTIAIALISILYLLVVFSLEKFLQFFFGYQSILVSILTAFFLGILFIPLRYKIQYLIDQYFFKGSANEISQQNEQLRQEIIQSEKHKTLTTIATGIAHEVKNPLTAIKTFCEYLPDKLDDKVFLKKFANIVGQEVERINEMTNQLLDYGKPAPLAIKNTDIHKLINSSIDILNSKFLDQKIEIIKNFQARQDLHLNVDPNQLRQALLNVLLNAVEAMPNGGKLTVSSLVTSTSYFIITIEDTGVGISREDLSQIFDPFFSKKDSGTGLGLSITETLIKNHNGIIQIKSQVGIGTTVEIELPLLT